MLGLRQFIRRAVSAKTVGLDDARDPPSGDDAIRSESPTSQGAGPDASAATPPLQTPLPKFQPPALPPSESLTALNTGPKVTVIITCYSGELYFEEAALSVRAQSYRNVDLVFHDNGTQGRYAERIREVALQLNATVVRTPVNRYGEGLRADVLPFLESDFIAILHDDDFYHPQKLAICMGRITAENLDYLMTDREYVSAAGTAFAVALEEVNRTPVTPDDFPAGFIADTFYRGLRLHFSTLVMKGSLARRTLLGDPFLPRITDSYFMHRLLYERELKGTVLPDKLSYIRVHGANDMLYSKFSGNDLRREVTLLKFGEYSCFQDLLNYADDQLLGAVFRIFPGVAIEEGDSRAAMLVKAALDLRNWGDAKPAMAAYCIHQAFQLSPLETMESVRRLSGVIGGGPEVDANTLTQGLYRRFMDILRASLSDSEEEIQVRLNEAWPALREKAEAEARSEWPIVVQAAVDQRLKAELQGHVEQEVEKRLAEAWPVLSRKAELDARIQWSAIIQKTVDEKMETELPLRVEVEVQRRLMNEPRQG